MGHRRCHVRRHALRRPRWPELRLPRHLRWWRVQVVDGLEISDATRAGIDHNIKALQEEYDAVKALGFIK